MRFEIESDSPQKTKSIGEKIGKLLKNGDVVLMNGDLGAGKTCMTKGIALSLGTDSEVTSPTYTIVNEYESKKAPVFHYDCYRLGSGDELYDIGFEDSLADGIVIMEWADNVKDIFGDFVNQENTFYINIKRLDEIGLDNRLLEVIIPEGRCENAYFID